MNSERGVFNPFLRKKKDVFNLSGPLHLTSIDWENEDHKRSVVASLVQGVYLLERDRHKKRTGPEALAPPWWEFFNFRLYRLLVDDGGVSIFGAIYELKPAVPDYHVANASSLFVIAFRGTITKLGAAWYPDVKLNTHIFINSLYEASRFEIAMQAVRNTVATFGNSNNIWIAGHSQGSAMAILAGKTMAKEGIFLKAFLFNSPFLSPPIEIIKNENVKNGIRLGHSLITAGLALAAKKAPQQMSPSGDPFFALSPWTPCLYVNRADRLCSEYIGYFEHRERMEHIGAGGIERLATQQSVRGFFTSVVTGKESEEPFYLLPSANLRVNSTPSPDFRSAHGIAQWWSPDLTLESKLYQY